MKEVKNRFEKRIKLLDITKINFLPLLLCGKVTAWNGGRGWFKQKGLGGRSLYMNVCMMMLRIEWE